MKFTALLTLLALPFLLASCGEPEADVSDPKTHRSEGITFQYPKNWKVTDESSEAGIHYFTVETPGTSLVVFQSIPLDTADDLKTFAKAFSDSAAEQTPLGKVADTKVSKVSKGQEYEWMTEDFSIQLLGESVPHRRLFGSKVIGKNRVFLIFQAATEDLAKAKPGFDLIRDTLEADKGEKNGGDGE